MPPTDTTAVAQREQFRRNLEDQMTRYAHQFLVDLVGEAKAKQAAARLGLAMRQTAMANAAQTEQGKASIYDATPAAIANAIAMCALTDLQPGGQHADCWIFPKGGSAGGLQWMMSHRGVMKLARRAGWEVRAVCVHGARDGEDALNADEWNFSRSPFPSVHHVPRQPDPGWETLERVYVYFWPIGKRDEYDVYVLEKPEIVARRARAQGRGQTWQDWPLEMAMKSAIKAAAARGLFPLDYESNLALREDDRNEEDNTDTTVPAPQRTSTPSRSASEPRRLSSVDELDRRLGPDDEPDREPVPVEPEKKTRAPRRPKEQPTPDNSGDGQPSEEVQRALNEQNELIERLKEAERKVGPDHLPGVRGGHGFAATLTAAQIVKQHPVNQVLEYVKDLES